ncbi:MAG: hypothetical protein ACSLFK_12590 [Gemmatimonadaceae bacterium]
MTRRVVAVTVIAIWIVGLALLYNRTTNRTPEQELVEAALLVSPATYYYILRQDGRQVGAASSAIDTTNSRIISNDFLRGAIPVGDDVLRMEARSEARFTRGLRLRDFVIRVTGDLTPFFLRGAVQEGEDKTLRVTAENAGEKPITLEHALAAPVFIPTVAPVPLMLRGNPKIGDSLRLTLFDPVTRGARDVMLRIEADSLFLVADSAHLDTSTKRWVKARQDSLRGWRVTPLNAPFTAWVDAYGRLIAASEPGGISLVRTAFEMAFENWRLDQLPTAPDSGVIKDFTQ